MFMATNRGWSNQERKDITSRYQSGESSVDIASDYNVSAVTIRNRLEKWGVERRSRSDLQSLGQLRENDVDDSYFSNIDGGAKAYWLGFINADGCVTTQNRLTVEISQRDQSHLEKLRQALSAEHSIYERGELCRLVITSKKLSDSLKSLGVEPRKSKTSGKSVKVPDGLESHFWRGVVDGDGHYSKSQRTIVLAGNQLTVQDFASWVNSVAPMATTKPYEAGRTVRAHVCGQAASIVAQRLYKDSTPAIRLERKYEIAKEYWVGQGMSEPARKSK